MYQIENEKSGVRQEVMITVDEAFFVTNSLSFY